MSAAVERQLVSLDAEHINYLTDEKTIWSWLFTTDHKRIALLYFASITVFFFLGGAAAAVMRINLLTPTGLIIDHEMYNRMFTLHGVVMVWFFLVPAIPVTLGNFVTPLMLGARDLAFPRVNIISWYLFISGGILALIGLAAGGVDTGWTFYAPLSTNYAKGYVTLVCFGIILSGYSSIATGLNFIVTIHKLRPPGMGWYRLPLFLWSLYSTSVIYVLATPVLTMAMILLLFERIFRVGVFDPALGGDPLLFQHLFWFYSHPAVYIMILPGFGVVSEVITAFSRKSVFGYKFIAWSSVSIAVISFFVWGHHMFVAGTSLYSDVVFSLLSFIVAVPSAIKVFNWLGTLHKGFIRFDAPMLYVLGFIGLFTMGGLTGLFVAALGADVHLHDTYFVVAHFHYIMVGAMVSAFFAGLHYWWPKITGRMYHGIWGQVAAVMIFFGFNMTFFPQFILGYMGMPRRYGSYDPQYQVLNVISSLGAVTLAVAYTMPLIYLTWSLFRGAKAPPNPWDATGLEWQTQSPPRTENFSSTPVVTYPPYYYPKPEQRQHV